MRKKVTVIVNLITLILLVNSSAFGKIKETFKVGEVNFDMIFIEKGTFQMGNVNDDVEGRADEKPVHGVTLSSYYIGQTEVTQELWMTVMGSNPSKWTAENGGGLNHPVENITWEECQLFIKKLNETTGQTFRLPTEAEWEFAAKGSNGTKNYKYAGSNDIEEVAWYRKSNRFR